MTRSNGRRVPLGRHRFRSDVDDDEGVTRAIPLPRGPPGAWSGLPVRMHLATVLDPGRRAGMLVVREGGLIERDF
jgi:hypothetical protein